MISHENSQWLHYRVQQYLRGQQILQGLGILPQGSSSPLTFQDLAGHQFTLQVTPGNQPTVSAPDPSLGPLPLPFYRNGRNYWYLYSAPLRLLYLQYAVCQNVPPTRFPRLRPTCCKQSIPILSTPW